MKKSHETGGKAEGPAKDARPPSRVDRALRALEWPGAPGWVGTGFALAALWFVVSALVLNSKRARMEAPSPDARSAAEAARSWGFGDRFLLPVLVPNEAGVVAREGLDPGAKGVAVVLGPDRGATVLHRSARGGPEARGGVPFDMRLGPPRWVRLLRSGAAVEAAVSPDGVTWAPARPRAIDLPRRVLAGVVARPAASEPCVARFRALRVEPRPAGEWRDGGEGEATPPRASAVRGASATVASGGASTGTRGGTSHFVCAEVEGDFEIVAQVAAIEPAHVLPEPLSGQTLARARLAVAANARASGVFAFFAAVLAALLWGVRLRDPSVRAGAAGSAKKDA